MQTQLFSKLCSENSKENRNSSNLLATQRAIKYDRHGANIRPGFEDCEWYFELVNHLSNPNNITNKFFPLLCIFDSVFGAQLLLCMAFGGWLNSILKLLFQEKRPYWWVDETSFYNRMDRPYIWQTSQTCETGFGSPSGHSMAAATTVLLLLTWIEHIMHDMKCYCFWWKYVMYPLSAFILSSVVLSRLYIGAHFPHQCVIGALIGYFLTPALCFYVSDPYIWRYGSHSHADPGSAQRWHVLGSIATMVISVLVYYGLDFAGHDPQWTIKMAFRSCERPENIHVSSTPVYALTYCTASLLGLALAATPDIARYRHFTKHRSIILSALSTIIINYACKYILENARKSNKARFYSALFTVAALKPMFLLRVAPTLAMLPFGGSKDKIQISM